MLILEGGIHVDYEPVDTITHYYDGPQGGVASERPAIRLIFCFPQLVITTRGFGVQLDLPLSPSPKEYTEH